MKNVIARLSGLTYLIFSVLIILITIVVYLFYNSPKIVENNDSGFEIVTVSKQYQEVSATHNRINFGPFSMIVPKEYVILRMTRLYDSYLGGITNGKDSIMFDYGWYSYDLRNDGNVIRDTINGQIAYLKRYKNSNDESFSLGFYNFHKENKLIVYSENTNNQSESLEILKSIVIKGSPSNVNSNNFGNNYSSGVFAEGKYLFENNCASCHNINKVMVGPALKDILKRRKMNWLIKWVQNPQKLISKKDPYALNLVKDYETAGIMPSFQNLSKKEIKSIILYIEKNETLY